MNSERGRVPNSVAELIDLERAQIGHDLHDLLIPLIFSASAELHPLIHRREGDVPLAERDQERVRISQGRLEEALLLSRGLLTQIYPPELEHQSWLFAAKDLVERIAQDLEVVWKVEEACPLLATDLPRDIASAAFRILAQGVRNAIDHGGGETIAIRLLGDKLLIVDDGKGFDPESVPADRFGIRAMRGRAQLIGKPLQVESEVGGPTTITLGL